MEAHKIIKPSMWIAAGDIISKNIFFSIIITGVSWFMLWLLRRNGTILMSDGVFMLVIILLFLGTLILPSTFFIVRLANTKYYIMNDRIMSEFEFMIVRKQSVFFDKIVDVQSKASMWARAFGGATLQMNTAEDISHPLIMKHIKEADKIEAMIFHIISKHKSQAFSSQPKHL